MDAAYKEKFDAAIYDDFATPEAIAVMWELIKDERVAPGVKRATLLDFDRILGIGLSQKRAFAKVAVSDIPEAVAAMVAEREAARKAGDWARADAVRDAVRAQGFDIEDTPRGPRVKPVLP